MSTVEHKDRKHALLSASGSSRWLNCTPSARLEEQFEDPPASKYAEEGTLAHEFAELELRKTTRQITAAKYKKEVARLEKDPLYSPEMPDYVQEYVDYVMEEYNEAKKLNGDAVLLIEQVVDLTQYVEEGYGTNDSMVISDGVLEVIDLKYGKGIRVGAEENSQLMLYGLGALVEHELTYDIHTVKLTIVQPRLKSVSSWEISAEDLLKWGEATVRPKAELAFEGEGVQKAGDWCKWCKAKASCATLASINIKLAKGDFVNKEGAQKDPHLLTEKQLLEIYKKIPLLVDWANAISKYMLEQAKEGKEWKGYKLVEGKSNRKWADEQAIIKLLKSELYEEDEFMTPRKLGGIGMVEKLLGKKDFNKLLGDLVVKPQGSPTLVEESDKRPALGADKAKDDFSD